MRLQEATSCSARPPSLQNSSGGAMPASGCAYDVVVGSGLGCLVSATVVPVRSSVAWDDSRLLSLQVCGQRRVVGCDYNLITPLDYVARMD